MITIGIGFTFNINVAIESHPAAFSQCCCICAWMLCKYFRSIRKVGLRRLNQQ
jgi:hypothetical protein